MRVLILLHIFSMGLKSGLYEGRYFILISLALNFFSSKLFLCDERLSIITVSPGLRTGSKNFSIYTEKIVLFTAPSKTIHCVVPSRRTDESMVVVFHEPETEPKHLSPFADLPRNGHMFVFAEDSSRKTSDSVSHVSAQASHSFLAVFISSLCCSEARSVFFYM